ncbi:MAG: insulinase family protein [Candidatus Stahlbacteria bacterium]|nr:insulinase family protein [Candidatus Stahlbacteria bacterium]
MKRLFIIVLGSIIFTSCVRERPYMYQRVEELKFNPIEWRHPEPKRIQLDNGIVLYVLEDHELPLIDGSGFIKAGAVYDTEDKVGLSEITARVIRAGGTKNRSPEEIDSIIEYNAARIEFNIEEDAAVSCGFSALKENMDEVLDIFADIVMNPAFREDKFSVEMEKLKEEIRRRNESPMEVAFVNFTKKLRRGHPTGRFPTIATVNKITQQDVIEFHEKYYRPNNLILSIAGDFEVDSLVNKLNKAFKKWEKSEIAFPKIQDLEERYEKKVYYVEKDVKQSTIIMGHLSIYRKDPDLYSLIVANRILGGNMSSRLFKKVRDEQGLAYTVGSYLSPGNLYRGDLGIYCQTDAGNTGKAIKLILEEAKKMQKEEVEGREIEDNKEGIKNRFVFTFESPLQIARNAAYLEFYDLERDYYDKYIENIDKVSRATLLDAMERKFLPDKMEILIVGKMADFDIPLDSLGKVEKIELEE